MDSIFDKTAYNRLVGRIKQLRANSQPTWGKMNVGQMLEHCALPCESAIGKYDAPNSHNLFWKMTKFAAYNKVKWAKNLQTARGFVVTEEVEFKEAKKRLLTALEEMRACPIGYEWHRHARFGKFNRNQWGHFTHKHLDHHLRQFGV